MKTFFYYIFPSIVGGRPHWTKNEDKYAVWFHNQQWRIGLKSNMGTESNLFWGAKFLACPESDGNSWWWYDDKGGLDAGDDARVISYSGKNPSTSLLQL